jgi:predicted phosphatase
MIDIIITSYNEPKSTLRAVKAFLNQKIKQKFRITVVDPFPEVGEFLEKNITLPKFFKNKILLLLLLNIIICGTVFLFLYQNYFVALMLK